MKATVFPLWLMILLVLIATVAIGSFVYLSFNQLTVSLNEIKSSPDSLSHTMISSKEKSQLLLKASLEYDYQANKQHNLESFIAMRTWMRFMSLVFGAIVIAVGSIFILGRINAPITQIEGEGLGASLKFSIATSSPGIIMVILGMVLISIPNVSSQQITTSDAPLYLVGEVPNYLSADKKVKQSDDNYFGVNLNELKKEIKK